MKPKIIWETDSLTLLVKQNSVKLLTTDKAFFTDENKNYIGNTVLGYATCENGNISLTVNHINVKQIFPDGTVWDWRFNGDYYERV